MYEVLGLESVVNVSQVAEFQVRYGIAEQVAELQQQIRLNSKVVILTDEARKQLNALAISPLSDIDFTAYNDLVENQITSINLNKLANALRDTARKLPRDKHVQKVYYLENEAMFLETSQDRIVDVMAQLSRQLRANTTALQEDLKFNHTSLRDAVHGLIKEVESAQEYLSVNGPDEVIEVSEKNQRECASVLNMSCYSWLGCSWRSSHVTSTSTWHVLCGSLKPPSANAGL